VKKRFAPTLAAFVILMLLLVYANYYETDEILAPGAQKPLSILNCSAGEITSIAWKTGEDIGLKVEYADGKSRITVPAEFRSDKNEADGIARHFAELKSELVVVENATDTAAFGIDANAPAVMIETASGVSELKLGSKSQIGNSYYLQKKGDARIFMVPGYISGSFARALEDLRDRQLFIEDFGQVSSITIESQDGKIELRQSASLSDWQIESPVKLPADGVVVAELLQNLQNIRVSRFVEDHPENTDIYGFASPSLKIRLVAAENREFGFEAGEMTGVETFVRIADDKAVHAAQNSMVNSLRLRLTDLREKFLHIPALSELTEMTVTDATGSITIEKKDTGWMVGIQKINDADVKNFVNSLVRSRVNSFAPAENLEAYGLHDKDKCRNIELRTNAEKINIWLGMRKGASQSLLMKGELIDISAELDDAFVAFMRKLRRSPEEVKVIVAEPSSVTEDSQTK